MQQKKIFGRRVAPDTPRQSSPPWIPKVTSVDAAERAPILPPPSSNDDAPDVDRELEEWKAERKRQRRTFREPWRTLSIATTVGFGASFWLLPDSVANVVQFVTGGLAVATFIAGFRGTWQKPPAPTEKTGPAA